MTDRPRADDSLPHAAPPSGARTGDVHGAVFRCEVRPPHRALYVSDGIFEITGVHASAYLLEDGPRLGSLAVEEDRQRLADAEELARGGGSFDLEYRLRRPDGAVRRIRDRGRVVLAPDRTPQWIERVVMDITALADAEVALRESEERFRTLAESLPGAVYRRETAWPHRELSVSQGVEAISGDGPARHVGPDGLGLVLRSLPEDRAPIELAVSEAVAQRSAYVVRYRIRHADGGVRWVQDRGRAAYAPDGTPLHLDGFLVDVTPQVQTEAKLGEQEETLRTLVASVPGAVYLCTIDPPWRSTFMSEGTRALTGYDPEEFLRPDGVSFLSLTLPEDVPGLAPAVATAIREHEPFVLRYRISDAGGDIRWVMEQGRAAYAANGEPLYLVGVITDVTDRMRAEEDIRASRARLIEAQRIAHIGSWELDLRSNVLVWSEEVYRIFEVSPGQFDSTYEAFLQTIHPEDAEMVDRAYSKAVRNHEGYEIAHRLLMPDGRTKFVQERAETFYDDAGVPIRSVGTVQDVTERRTAEAAREALEARLRQAQKMEAIGTLAGGIAHDFNNILTAIIGQAELLGVDLPRTPRLTEGITAILQASERARLLVQQILTFSRRREREQRPMPLQPVIEEALKLLRSTLPGSVELRSSIANDDLLVSADATELHQVILNLCTNAAQAFSERGGVVTVSFGTAELDEEFAAAHPDLRAGRHAVLSISDTGPGMNPETLERIFEPFFTTKPPGQGTGLGLAVVHGIIENHGGAIAVKSQLGEGTTFDLYLPIATGTACSDVPPPPLTTTGQGEHVLVLDDEPMVVDIVRQILTRLGYRVSGFTQPRQALAALEAAPGTFDLLLTDLTMPGITGLDIAERARRLRPDMPILLASGYSGALEPTRLMEAGIRELVGKPFRAGALADAVRRNVPPREHKAD